MSGSADAINLIRAAMVDFGIYLSYLEHSVDVDLKSIADKGNEIQHEVLNQLEILTTNLKEYSKEQHKKIQIMDAVKTRTTIAFGLALQNKLKERKVYAEVLGKENTVNTKLPLLFLCQPSSRLEPDVDQALQGVQLTSKCAMIIIHTGAESNLPKVPSDTKLHGYSKYEYITFVDMGFDDQRGIYKCNQNDQSIAELSNMYGHRGNSGCCCM